MIRPPPQWTFLLALAMAGLPLAGQSPPEHSSARISFVRGLTIVETLQFSGGDRESVTTIEEATAAGVRYAWHFVEVRQDGDTIRGDFRRFVSATDLADAGRLYPIFERDATEKPGYTLLALSRASYRQLQDEGTASFAVMLAEPPRGASGPLAQMGIAPPGGRLIQVLWRGTLTRASPSPMAFPLLLNGQRITVPALHLHGSFRSRGRHWEPELWVLADSASPLLLRITRSYPGTDNVLQTVKVDETAPEAGDALADVEAALSSACRVELPGIYFAFDSAELNPASEGVIAGLAGILDRHTDWRTTVEGHTDSIGSASANRILSERRAQEVRTRLITAHGIGAERLVARGHGADHPREDNSTIEGRARNRRVELVRECGPGGR